MSGVSEPSYWDAKYQEAAPPPWDLGRPSPVLEAWLAEHPGIAGRALVPGAGQGHDAVALARAGLDVVAVDFAPTAVAATRELAAAAGVALEAVEGDALAPPAAWDGTFDWVFEHTCFCAIDPDRRDDYVAAAARVLKPGGRLVGVFFTHGDVGGPPFDTNVDELRARFGAAFEIEGLAVATTSIEKRAGEETVGEFRRRAPGGVECPSEGRAGDRRGAGGAP